VGGGTGIKHIPLLMRGMAVACLLVVKGRDRWAIVGNTVVSDN
jgi:hypothetical protein